MSWSTRGPRHLLGAMGMNEWELRLLLDRADAISGGEAPQTLLDGQIVVLGSDRRVPPAWDAAVLRIGGRPVHVALAGTIDAMATQVDALAPSLAVLSHAQVGVPSRIARRLSGPVIGAGDGAREDLPGAVAAALAVRRALGGIEGRHIALVGNVARSALARSALIFLGALGARLRLVAPSALLPSGAEVMGAAVHADPRSGLADTDAAIVLSSIAAVAAPNAVALDVDWMTDRRQIAAFCGDAVLIGRVATGTGGGTMPTDPSAYDVPVMMAMILSCLEGAR